MIGKIEAIYKNGQSFDTQYGKLFPFKVTINGEEGAYYAKTEEAKYKVGDEVEYDLQRTDKGNKIKIKGTPKPEFKKKGGSNASFALSYAKDLAVAHLAKGNDFGAKEIIQVADVFKKWLDENE